MKGEAIFKEIVVGKPHSRSATPITYCPGCHYGIITRLICEVIDDGTHNLSDYRRIIFKPMQ